MNDSPPHASPARRGQKVHFAANLSPWHSLRRASAIFLVVGVLSLSTPSGTVIRPAAANFSPFRGADAAQMQVADDSNRAAHNFAYVDGRFELVGDLPTVSVDGNMTGDVLAKDEAEIKDAVPRLVMYQLGDAAGAAAIGSNDKFNGYENDPDPDEERIISVRLKRGETRKVSYYDPDADGRYDEKYSYRPKAKRNTQRDRLMERLHEQEDFKDGFHFDQSFDQKKALTVPRLGIVLSSKECRLTPSAAAQPDATYMVIECPHNVPRVTAQFLSGAPFKEALSASGWSQQKTLAWSLDEDGRISTRYIKACLDPKMPDTCYYVQIDAKRLGNRSPSGSRLFASHSVQSPSYWPPKSTSYKLKAFENEPFGITLESASDAFLDEKRIQSERGHIDQTRHVVVRPRGEIDYRAFYFTDKEHANENNVTVEIETVPSANPYLHDLRTSVGRLDPKFSSNHYTYYLRVNEFGPPVTSFRLTGKDDKNVVCSYVDSNGESKAIVGAGSTKFLKLGPKDSPSMFVFDCRHPGVRGAHQPKARYIIQTVYQKGGSTLLRSLNVVGADMRETFTPENKGVYEVELRRHGDDASETDMPWISFHAVPRNTKAEVTVEGFPVDPNSGFSPYFRVPLGDIRKFKIAVRTAQNPVAEIYEVAIARRAPHAKRIRQIADWLGYVSTAMSSPRAYTFLHNAKFLQWMSTTNRIKSVPETWSLWSGYMHKWNLQWRLPKIVSLPDYEDSPSEGYRRVHILPGPERHSNLSFPNAEVAYAEILSQKFSDVRIPGALEWSDKLQGWRATIAGTDAVHATLTKLRTYDSLLSYAFRGISNEEGGISAGEEGDMDNEDFGSCAPGDDCTAVQAAAAERANNRALAHGRTLLAISSEDRQALIQQLEESHKDTQKVLDFATSVIATTIGLAVIGVTYWLIWSSWLRSRERPGHIRRDFMRILHPARFWIFVLDYSLIAYFQACCGLLFTPLKNIEIAVFGYATSPRDLSAFCIVLMIFIPVLFVAISILALAIGGSKLTFSKVFQRHGDIQPTSFKAIWSPFSSIPIIGRLFDVEITHFIEAADVTDGDGKLFPPLVEDKHSAAPWLVHDNMAVFPQHSHTTPSEEEYLMAAEKMRSKLPSDLKYYKDLDAVRIGVCSYPDGVANSNAGIAAKYPDAFFAFVKQPIRNRFGAIVNVFAKARISDVGQMLRCSGGGETNVILPREHLGLEYNDAISNLVAKAQMGNFFYWAIDRVAMIGLILVASLMEDASNAETLLVFTLAALALALLYFPGVLQESISRWYRKMESDFRLEERVKRYDIEDDKKFNVWPFRDEEVRQHYQLTRFWRYQQRAVHPFYGIYGLFFDFSDWLIHNDVWRCRAAKAAKVFLTGPCFSEVCKFLICLMLLLSGRGYISNGFATMAGTSVSVIAVAFLNWEALEYLAGQLRDCGFESYIGSRRVGIAIVDTMNDLPSMSRRLGFYFQQLLQYFTRASGVISFIYPGFQKETLRDFAVKEIMVINNEIGLHMRGKVKHPLESRKKMFLREDPLSNPRFDIQKTLCIASTIATYRSELDRAMPVVVHFKPFVTRQKSQATRLAATVQIINHAGLRYLPRIPHSTQDDSFFTLYFDDDMVPPPALLKKGVPGHGYVMKVDRLDGIVRIRGPNLQVGCSYTVKVRDMPSRDKFNPIYSMDERSQESSEHYKGRASDEVFCHRTGRLIVIVPGGCTPDFQEEISITVPGGRTVTHDPTISKVYYDPESRHMIINTQHALADSRTPYKVEWVVRNKGPRKLGPTSAQAVASYGHMVFPLKDLGDIRSDAWVIIKDTARTVTIDVDASQTNRHEICLPELANNLTGATGWLTSKVAKLSREFDTLIGAGSLFDSVGERIPCTIVQCVDPVERLWRVEPDFDEAILRVCARKEELFALNNDLKQGNGASGRLWHRIITPEEYVQFWNDMGIQITDKRGLFKDPVRVPPRGQEATVRAGESRLEALLASRLSQLNHKLSELQQTYRVWATAYRDEELYESQYKLDQAQQFHADDLDLLAQAVEEVRRCKANYVNALPNFRYPMVLPEDLISKRANWEAQFIEWERVLRRWLRVEEGATEEDATQGSVDCYGFVVEHIMKALRHTIFKEENLLRALTHTALHYVTSSLHVRGVNVHWKPDPLGSMFALIRCWGTGEQDWTFEKWVPGYLKLTGTSVRISVPDGLSLEGQPEWHQLRSWDIPLKCFEGVVRIQDDKSPVSQNDMAKTMTGRLVLRRTTEVQVDDDYVMPTRSYFGRHTEPEDFDNRIDYETQILLGHKIERGNFDTANAAWYEYQDIGDYVYVAPLTFRLWPRDLERWDSVVSACCMNEPHRDLRDWNGIVPRVPVPEKEPPPLALPESPSIHVPTGVSSSSSSEPPTSSFGGESTSDATSEIMGDGDARPPPLVIPEPKPQRPTSNVVPYSQIEEPFADWRYHGYGDVREPIDNERVYDGEWHGGQRNGKGRAAFRDAEQYEWRYHGEMKFDEPSGHGHLELIDSRQIGLFERSQGSGYNHLKKKIVGLEGYFQIPRHYTRGDTIPTASHPAVDIDAIDKLYHEAGRTHIRTQSQNVEGQHRPYILRAEEVGQDGLLQPFEPPITTLVLDRRRTMSAVGHELLLGVTMSNLNEFFHKDRAPIRAGGDTSVANRHLGDAAVNEYSDDYLPHTGQWLRHVDPSLGQWDMGDRMGVGEVHYADGRRLKKFDQVALVDNEPNSEGQLYCPACPLNISARWTYDDEIRRSRPHGWCIMAYGKGEQEVVYAGHLNMGRREGKAVLSAYNGKIYITGQFKNDLLDGKCRIEVDPSIYSASKWNFRYFEGEFVDGLPNGFGEIMYFGRTEGRLRPGVLYRGQWKRGLRHGSGGICSADGEMQIKGGWEDDTAQGGANTYYMENGNVYIGEMALNYRSGQGKLFESVIGGLIYDGAWDKDMAHGRGTCYGPDGVYEGEFQHGRPQGYGIFTFKATEGEPNRRVYEGSWADGQPHGVGRFTDSDGMAYVLQFDHGTIVPRSARAYRKGMCGSPPNLSTQTLQVEAVSELSAVSREFQHEGSQTSREAFSEISQFGTGVWIQKHEAHPFAYHPIYGDMPELPVQPVSMPEWDVESSPPPPRLGAGRHTSGSSSEHGRDLAIVVTVISAKGIKKRGPFSPKSRCRVMFWTHDKVTHLADGTEPEWNAPLAFPYVSTLPKLVFTIGGDLMGGIGSVSDLHRETDRKCGTAIFDLKSWVRAGANPGQFEEPLYIEKRHGEAVEATGGSVLFRLEVVLKDTVDPKDLEDDYMARGFRYGEGFPNTGTEALMADNLRIPARSPIGE